MKFVIAFLMIAVFQTSHAQTVRLAIRYASIDCYGDEFEDSTEARLCNLASASTCNVAVINTVTNLIQTKLGMRTTSHRLRTTPWADTYQVEYRIPSLDTKLTKMAVVERASGVCRVLEMY